MSLAAGPVMATRDASDDTAAGPGPGSLGRHHVVHDNNPLRVYKLLFAGGEKKCRSIRNQSAHNATTTVIIRNFVPAGCLSAVTGLAGALSRTATAPIDRLKMLLQVQEERMSIREGLQKMASEGESTMDASWGPGSCGNLLSEEQLQLGRGAL